jgi:hypothetical protein
MREECKEVLSACRKEKKRKLEMELLPGIFEP